MNLTAATPPRSLRLRLRRILSLLRHPTQIGGRKRRQRRRREQRKRLLSLLPEEGVGAEIGTWEGDFAATILSSRHPRQLYLIDPWEYRSETEYQQAWYGGTRVGQDEMDVIHKRVTDRFSSELERGQVVMLRARSVDAAASLPDKSLDWVYIDGDHTYEAVRSDLEAFYRTVKPGA